MSTPKTGEPYSTAVVTARNGAGDPKGLPSHKTQLFDPNEWLVMPSGLFAMHRDDVSPCRCCGSEVFTLQECKERGELDWKESARLVCPTCLPPREEKERHGQIFRTADRVTARFDMVRGTRI
jgi:hypothetical protein